ncbi:MAG: L,D-transpeptidase [Verrucomicrobiales bacterium]
MTFTSFKQLLQLGAAGSLVSCASTQPVAQQQPTEPPPLFEWWGEGASGTPSIRINVATQRAKFFRNGQMVGWTTVATGLPKYPTPTGRFRIQDKEVDRISYTYGAIVNESGEIIDADARRGREPIPPGARFEGSPMPYWMQITSYGIGMHAGIIPRPGHPASHSCIRLPREMAETFYEHAPLGTAVTIVRDHSEAEELAPPQQLAKRDGTLRQPQLGRRGTTLFLEPATARPSRQSM